MDLAGWNDRHRTSVPNFTPDSLLVSAAQNLPPGRALDLACGAGRNALWLAERGWGVTAVDGSPAAIDILRGEAARRNLTVDSRIADLERGEYTIEPRSWDLVAMCRYLQRDLLETAKSGVVPGGLVIAIVLVVDRERTKYRLNPGELLHYFEGWEILQFNEATASEHGPLAEIVARRPNP
ncbi:MAG TPA: methyltransferase domain-containing protein [Bryobacteraceae bacterium]|jgi:tellurite methyltransferase|nr:methyltransferase domain-containing protein [Bryobacteraceae bacterium]